MVIKTLNFWLATLSFCFPICFLAEFIYTCTLQPIVQRWILFAGLIAYCVFVYFTRRFWARFFQLSPLTESASHSQQQKEPYKEYDAPGHKIASKPVNEGCDKGE